jgi:molybdopterin molybdotransferase
MGNMDFVRVSMQPGGTQGFGTIGPDETPVFVLPANPVGALLSFDVFVRPLIRRMMGQQTLHHRVVEAVLDEDVESSADDTHYVRATVTSAESVIHVRSLESDETHPLHGLGTADALIIVPSGVHHISSGQTVAVMLLNS